MDAAGQDATPDGWSRGRRTLADYEREALAKMSPEALGYVEGGAGDEVTMADNVTAWRRCYHTKYPHFGGFSRDVKTAAISGNGLCTGGWNPL